MFHMVLPLYLSWRDLKRLGWPYSRAHTWRMMDDEEDPFPRCSKLAGHRNSHPLWYTPEVLQYFKRHGLTVPESLQFSQ
jgi:predicted DNA-binding transcriptional regulator AlpA